jgi:hypothetical protein
MRCCVGELKFTYRRGVIDIHRPSDINSVFISGVHLIRAGGGERKQNAPTFVEAKGRPEGSHFICGIGRSWTGGRIRWSYRRFMEPVPHHKPHRNVGMRFPFVHVPGSHEITAEEDVGLDFLYRVIWALRWDPDLREGSGEEYGFLCQQGWRGRKSDTPEVDGAQEARQRPRLIEERRYVIHRGLEPLFIQEEPNGMGVC